MLTKFTFNFFWYSIITSVIIIFIYRASPTTEGTTNSTDPTPESTTPEKPRPPPAVTIEGKSKTG